MNCKKGDMALIIKSHAGNEGKSVTCLEYMGSVSMNTLYHDYWRTDTMMPTNMGSNTNLVRDAYLVPIGTTDKTTEQVKELEIVE